MRSLVGSTGAVLGCWRSPRRAFRHRPAITQRIRSQEAITMMSGRAIGAPGDRFVRWGEGEEEERKAQSISIVSDWGISMEISMQGVR